MTWKLIDSLEGMSDLGIYHSEISSQMALAVGLILKEDNRSRDEFAENLSEFVGEPVSKAMLDAYSSKARKDHGIPVHRFLGIVAVAGRWDVLDALLARYGVRVATRSDIELMRIGDAYQALKTLERHLDERK